jgi:calcium/calmodulin-dependent protein kinase I
VINIYIYCIYLIKIDHPNIIKIFEVYDEKTKLNLVLELMTGGELFDRIVEKESYSEKEAANILRPIVDAIRCFYLISLCFLIYIYIYE